MSRQFNNIKLPKVPRNKFNLSHERRLSADMFYLYPILVEDCIPGDIWSINNEIVIRCNPLVTPIMHEINVFVHYYFVPYRLLWRDFERYITGGEDGRFGQDEQGNFTKNIPVVSNVALQENGSVVNCVSQVFDVGGLHDHLGFNPVTNTTEYGKTPNFFPVAAYNFIWNEYYRDQNIIKDRKEMLQDFPGGQLHEFIWRYIRNQRNNPIDKGLEKRAWEKDYFTSALPWQQRGIAPAMPLSGITSALFPNVPWYDGSNPLTPNTTLFDTPDSSDTFGGIPTRSAHVVAPRIQQYLNSNVVDLSTASTFDVSDIRLAFQIQKFLERNARTGSRYVEFLKAHFPAYPRDDRLNRPEYIGGSRTPVIISEVLQTSQSNPGAPQGTMTGHGLSADRTRVAKYRVQEFGLIMGIMSIMPRVLYEEGIDRVWLKETKYDFYFPEFANLSEQAIKTPEIWNRTPQPIDNVFGYQGRYDEYRYKRNSVHGLFRNTYDRWTLSRKFANAPTLNADFLYPNTAESQSLKNRALAVPTEDMFLVAIANKNHVVRPLPYIAEPGLVDHG